MTSGGVRGVSWKSGTHRTRDTRVDSDLGEQWGPAGYRGAGWGAHPPLSHDVIADALHNGGGSGDGINALIDR